MLEADGSGRAALTYDLDPARLRAAKARVAERLGVPVPPEGPEDARIHPADPRWLEAQVRVVPGATLTEALRTALEDGRSRVTATLSFPSLEAGARAGLFFGGEAALERRPKKRWRFTLREPWASSGPGADDALGGLPPADLHRHHDADLAHVSHALSITFPVAVLTTNGALGEDGRTVRWSARGDDPAPRTLEAEFELPEDAAWPTFRARPDLDALTRRFLLPPPPPPPRPRDE